MGNPRRPSQWKTNQSGKVDEQEVLKWMTEGLLINFHSARIFSDSGSTQVKRTELFILRDVSTSALFKTLWN